jgi:LacI family transcriptional regulator
MVPRRVGIKDVAARARVSVGTVSNVLNQPEAVSDTTRMAVLAAIEELGFVRNGSAAQLRSSRRTVVGLVVLDVGNPFFTEVVRGAESALEQQGYTVLVCNSDGHSHRQERHLRFLEEQRVAGVLITPVNHRQDRRHLARLRERGLSVVLVDEAEDTEVGCSVAVDGIRGGELVGEHLLDIGRRRIVYLTGSDRIRQCRDRGEGLRRAVLADGGAGATVDEVPIDELNGHFGYAAVDDILALRPDAVFCTNDLIALGVLRGLFERGVSVPDDVALVGFDDIDFAQLASVPLTSVRQPANRIGEAAAGLLVEECAGGRGHAHQRIMFGPELIVRRSTDAAA